LVFTSLFLRSCFLSDSDLASSSDEPFFISSSDELWLVFAKLALLGSEANVLFELGYDNNKGVKAMV
jgi:hypothetical protein